MDQTFLKAMMAMFAPAPLTQEQQIEAFKIDSRQADIPLMELAMMSSAKEQKHFFDDLELSPLKVISLLPLT